MSRAVFQKLSQVLHRINRPGSFCVSGSVPFVLPGLTVADLGPVGLPLTTTQAKELKQRCEQAPYGKGVATVVDTKVRRVWRLTPKDFALTNPAWNAFLKETVQIVQAELGLEKQQLESHLYDLLLYEKGSFFLPHRDGEKLERMVATLVIVLPSSFQGGELIVRHDGQERTINFGAGEDDQFRIHFAAFYADCEHEVRPLREGYRLCLVYNLTLERGKQGIGAPRTSEYVEAVAELLCDWAKDDDARRLTVTLDHEYTAIGIKWDALKGVDRVKARVLLEAAKQADCRAYLALLTFHESGSAEGGYDDYYDRRRHWHDDEEEEDEGNAGEYEMGEVYDESLTADHWIDPQGQGLPLGEIAIEEDEILDPKAIKVGTPEEDFEGYTGNAGMTLDRWYRHAAVFLWPKRKHFDILCASGNVGASKALAQMVGRLRRAGKKESAALQTDCIEFAAKIIAHWSHHPLGYGSHYDYDTASDYDDDEVDDLDDAFDDESDYVPAQPKEKQAPLFESLVVLDDPQLLHAYLGTVMTSDPTADAGAVLVKVCEKHGWRTFQPELEGVVNATNNATLERNVRLLEHLCLAKPRKKEGWIDLCCKLAQAAVAALEATAAEKPVHDYWSMKVDRARVLTGLARALIATDQGDLLSQVVAHSLANPEMYPLIAVHVAALTTLATWLKKNVKEPCRALSDWLATCCAQLESLTAEMPQPPADFRRAAPVTCKCAECAELRTFLQNPQEPVHRFRARQERRDHLANNIRNDHCDLDCKTERKGSPHVLVCTKNTASYQARLKTYHENREHLATLRAIEASVPK